MFGNNKPFGTASTFGSSTFGANASPFGQTNTFGAKPATGNVFGTTAFGATTPQTGGLFGGTAPATGGSLFGQPSTAFGQPASTSVFGTTPAAGGLFGSTTPATQQSTGLFGGSSTSAFGSPRPTFGGFGATSTGTGLFGQSTNTGAGLFSSTPGFAAPATSGTTIKFNPPTSTDTMMKGGVSQSISTRHQCITCMKEYENKSFEELRLEDYSANRKGPTGGGIGAFGATTGQTGLFGSPAASTSAFSFGTTQAKPLFGTTPGASTFGSTGTGLFGQTSQQGTGMFGKPGGFGVPTTTTSGFTFGTSTGTSLFGQNTQQKSLFGQPTGGTGLFGQPTSSQQTGFGIGTGFGSFGTTSQPSTGLFGAKPTGFGTSNTTTTNTFSFGSSAAGGTGPFGAKTSTPSFGTGSAFGGTSTGFGGFGTTPGTSTGLFGQTKPATLGGFGTTGGFGSSLTSGFGTTPFSSSGLGTNTGSSLFGSSLTNKAPTFGFGTGSTGFGGFGQQSAPGSTFNFGATPGIGTTSDPNAAAILQQQIQAQQIFALTANPFGDNPLFRNTIRDPKRREDVLKPTNPAAQKAILASNQFKVSPLPAAKIKPKPITPVPNGKISLFDGLEDEEPSLGSMTFVPKRSIKKLVLKPGNSSSSPNLSLTVTSNISSAPNRSGDINFSTSVHVEKLPSLENINSNSPPSSSPLTIEIPNGIPDEGIETSPKSSDILPSSSSTVLQDSLYIRKPLSDVRLSSSCSPQSNPDDTIEALHTRRPKQRGFSLGMNSENSSHVSDVDSSRVASPDSTVMPEKDADDNAKGHLTGICLRRAGYYTIPTLDEIVGLMDDDGNCIVDNFTVGREGYGKVRFPGRINVSGLNLDEIVHFRRKEITIYPDDDNKPPVGEGLNRKAEITLDCVWPTDKTSHLPIKEPARLTLMGYQEKIEKSTSQMGAKFLEYRPETGSWVFEVDHFSKYGLQDSDDEDDSNTSTKVKTVVPPKKKVQILNGTGSVPVTPVSEQSQLPKKQRVSTMDDDDEMQDATDGTPETELFFSPLQQFVTSGVDAERIQGMKMSFFLDEVEENWGNDMEVQQSIPQFAAKAPDSYVKPIPIKKPVLESFKDYSKPRFQYFEDSVRMTASPRIATDIGKEAFRTYSILPPRSEISSRPSTSSPSVSLPRRAVIPRHTVSKVRNLTLRPFTQSLVHNKEKLIGDMGFFMSRSFRVGWGPNMTFVQPSQFSETSQAKPSLRAVNSYDLTVPQKTSNNSYPSIAVAVYKVEALSNTSVDSLIKVNLEKSLKVQLQHSVSTVEDGSPVFVPKPGIECIHAHANLMEMQHVDIDPAHPDWMFVKQCYHVWELCVALWGDIPDCDSSVSAYVRQMARREAFSKWLIETTKDVVQSEINNNNFNKHSYLSTIFSYLSRRQISKAVHLALENDDNGMSKLLAQAEGPSFVRKLVAKQLLHWRDSEAYKMVTYQRLKLYALLGGILFWGCHTTTINCCENVDWRRSLALHLWYYCAPTSSVQDAVREFEKGFMDPDPTCRYLTPPYPPYIDDDEMECPTDREISKSVLYDTCYHLLKLYCDRTHRLDKLLMPQMSTSAHLDFRLSWFLYQALFASGYQHLPVGVATALHQSFASQLEAMGMWHWAIFVMLHLPSAERRTLSVKNLLLRHVPLDSAKRSEEVESFLQEQLLVPREWIFEAKAIRARSFGLLADEAWYLLKAGSWSKSHRIIIEHLASDAIVNENYDYLLNFLKELAPAERSSTIIDWPSGGQVFLDYIHVSQMVESVLKGEVSAYDVEKLQPEVVSLCNRLASLQCPTAKDRLCQSEMAKKTATLLRAVFTLQEAKSGNVPSVYTLAPHIKNLPMPEDYAIQELRALSHNYFLAVTAE